MNRINAEFKGRVLGTDVMALFYTVVGGGVQSGFSFGGEFPGTEYGPLFAPQIVNLFPPHNEWRRFAL